MNPIQKRSFHQLYSRPILFVGLLLLLAGTWCYMQMQTNLFPEVLFPRITDCSQKQHQPGQLCDRRLFQMGFGHLCLKDPVGKPYQ